MKNSCERIGFDKAWDTFKPEAIDGLSHLVPCSTQCFPLGDVKYNEIYIPEEQVVYNDREMSARHAMMRVIEKSLIKRFIVSDLDRDDSIKEIIKLSCSHAVGVLEGRGGYEGITTPDETWLYEYKESDGRRRGGVAVVRNKKVVDYHPIWEGV